MGINLCDKLCIKLCMMMHLSDVYANIVSGQNLNISSGCYAVAQCTVEH